MIISLSEGSGCLPVLVPAFLRPALGNVTTSTNTPFSWWGHRAGRPHSDPHSRYWSQGIPMPCDPSYTPHIRTGRWRVTSGLSHRRGHSQVHSAQKSLPWEPIHFQLSPSRRERSFWETNQLDEAQARPQHPHPQFPGVWVSLPRSLGGKHGEGATWLRLPGNGR